MGHLIASLDSPPNARHGANGREDLFSDTSGLLVGLSLFDGHFNVDLEYDNSHQD